MATEPKPAQERLTVAPIVGPEDPRRFTDSGIEIEKLYTEEDLPEDQYGPGLVVRRDAMATFVARASTRTPASACPPG